MESNLSAAILASVQQLARGRTGMRQWTHLNEVISNGLIAGKHQAHQLLSQGPVLSCRCCNHTYTMSPPATGAGPNG